MQRLGKLTFKFEVKTMKMKKVISIILISTFSSIILSSCSQQKEMTSVTRPYVDNGYTFIEMTPLPAGSEGYPNSLDIKTVNCMNVVREEQGLEPLDFDPNLGYAAQTRAEECADKFSHTRPDGRDWYTVNQSICYGENLAYGYDKAEDVVDAWLASPAHRDLLLDDEFVTCGIGSYEEDNVTYIACEFGY